MTDSGEPHVPADGREPEPASGAGDRGGLPLVAPDGDGLRWSFELDLVSALEAIGRPLRDWHGVDQEEDLAAEVAALGFTDVPPDPADGPPGPEPAGAAPAMPPPRRGADLAGAVAEALPAGPEIGRASCRERV